MGARRAESNGIAVCNLMSLLGEALYGQPRAYLLVEIKKILRQDRK